jgi:hypothetical protein
MIFHSYLKKIADSDIDKKIINLKKGNQSLPFFHTNLL